MSEHDPTACHVCHRHAIGVGIGFTHSRDTNPKWICHECALIIEDVRRVRNFDAYEIKTLDHVDEKAGEYVGELGKTDMASMSELERRMLWKTVVQEFGNGLRSLIREGAPF
ncbi:hypothetical protein LB533_20455 [Mesorhizobium sp. BR1-1-13]|uniref:DUF6511 domain-containing protein n=1 Tax=Mesorhizobium sp. BR1-1-13 TaxID=2876656 RepID=UPI001CD17C61|nr:DUF6511 domain-containing protein [Mesorhizobium sp. BR1-1-13]MBZ9943461.1 hypothetical protein [Mesorhizobium sp. BR1-1-13]